MSLRKIAGFSSILLLAGVLAFFLPSTKNSDVPINLNGDSYSIGTYWIQTQLKPERPKVGNNQLWLALSDRNNRPISDATLEGVAEMPAMGSMPAMREKLTFHATRPGLYQGDFSLPMKGSWPLTLSLQATGQKPIKLMFDMNTSQTGLKLTQTDPPMANQPAVAASGLPALNIDPYRRQMIGVTFAEVVCRKLVKDLVVNARVTYDRSRLTDISLQFDAWIGKLYANFPGQPVKQGDLLLTVYSPNLISAQDDYLDSIKHASDLAFRRAARQRLRRWGLSEQQIKTIRKRGKAIDYLPVFAPLSGTVIQTAPVNGALVKAGQALLHLADLSRVWIEGEIYPDDVPWITAGMPAEIYLPGHNTSKTASVSFVSPLLNPKTRSAVVRVVLDNPDGRLRPESYAEMHLKIQLGPRLVVPESAVIYAGQQRIVFIDKGQGRLQPVKIKTGLRTADWIEVLDGLHHGDRVVTSANFLIAAESKLKSGVAQW